MLPARRLATFLMRALVIAFCADGVFAHQSDFPVLAPPQTGDSQTASSVHPDSRLRRLPAVEEARAVPESIHAQNGPEAVPRELERLPLVEEDVDAPAGALTPAEGPTLAAAAPPTRIVPDTVMPPPSPDDSPSPSDLPASPRAASPMDGSIPPGFVPWWQAGAVRPLRAAPVQTPVDINSLIVDTLRYSARVRAISDNAIVAETAITRAAAAFDVTSFMESKFVRTSIPTGSTLEAGFNVPRLREEDWFYRGGLRKRNSYGGRVEMAQQIGIRDSNSQFFYPYNQGNSRLVLSYNQPLLSGAGKAYNSSLIVLANLDTRVALDRTAAELQDQLLEVIESHWDLYIQRSLLLQRQAHLERAETILVRLEKRQDVDSLASQIARARAAVAARRTSLIRAGSEIRNAESRLRAIVNSPDMLNNRASELIPAQTPTTVLLPIELHDAFLTALENRTEIDAATQEIEAARVRLNVAKNELLPVLDVVLESYLSGLRGDYNIGQSWIDQFSVGEPSYTAGLMFEMPLDRRAAKANQQRRQAELRQLTSKFQATVETLNSEVEVAVREVDTTFREMQARFVQMMAAQSDMDYLQRRWESLPGDDRAASFLLEDLLDSQDRLAFAESAFVEAQVAYTISLTRLNRATGLLLKHEQVELVRESDACAPVIRFEKQGTPTPRREPLPAPR